MMMTEPLRFTGLRGSLRHGESLARYTSWRCGGAADVAYLPADRDDLAAFAAEKVRQDEHNGIAVRIEFLGLIVEAAIAELHHERVTSREIHIVLLAVLHVGCIP